MPMVEVAFRPITCNHCRQAPCVQQAAGDSVYQREDGIVMIDPDKARGKKEITNSCPYGVIWWNEEEQLAQKWNFDAHLLDQGYSQLRAEQVCPTGVFQSLKAEDTEMERIAKEQDLQVLRPELGTRPRVYYKNLDWFTKHYIGGTLVSEANGTAVAVSDVTVLLEKDGVQIRSAQTDQFGDFKFDGLEYGSGNYTVQYPGSDCHETTVELIESIYLGVLNCSDSC
ncbi:MAG TPA: 4Fe-4S dicluster domain-containing protein [Arenicellales bacterium]|jgi:Fe-S-cluster-containing hydrogenase component 2|nr:4Fe-4S dicluster domain-containing protein [Arenicellales bacterium]|tara:strand:+ start:452 stop:1129 length:678 start_codon:yes stop_codon:yes gene_type:complete